MEPDTAAMSRNPILTELGTTDAPVKIVVLDFDGTLVDSNGLKREAYYKLFTDNPDAARLIDGVLKRHFEDSRYAILRAILDGLRGGPSGQAGDNAVNRLAASYDNIARDGAKHCAEIAGAEGLLRTLHGHYGLYLSSTTPVESLREIVGHRGWSRYFRGIYGYPAEKSGSLRRIIVQEAVTAANVVVFGDGESDRLSARSAGCRFFPAGDATQIRKFLAAMEC